MKLKGARMICFVSPSVGEKILLRGGLFCWVSPFSIAGCEKYGKRLKPNTIKFKFPLPPCVQTTVCPLECFYLLNELCFFPLCGAEKRWAASTTTHKTKRRLCVCSMAELNFFHLSHSAFVLIFYLAWPKPRCAKRERNSFSQKRLLISLARAAFATKESRGTHRLHRIALCITTSVCRSVCVWLWLQPRVCCQFFSPLPSSAFAHSSRFLRL